MSRTKSTLDVREIVDLVRKLLERYDGKTELHSLSSYDFIGDDDLPYHQVVVTLLYIDEERKKMYKKTNGKGNGVPKSTYTM